MDPNVKGHNALAQILMEQTTLTGEQQDFVDASQRDVSEDCEWPSPTRPKISFLPTGASVLVLTIDAWRADLAEHHLDHVMPNLARRAQTGAYFKRAYAASTRTHESIYSLMTGQWPHRLTFTPAGVDKNDRFREIEDSYSIKQIQLLPLLDTSATLAQTLSQAGYKTAAIVPSVLPEGCGHYPRF